MTKIKKKHLKCDFDGCERKYFSTQWVLDEHLKRMHANEYLCSKCARTFDSASSLNEHKKSVHKGFSCHLCFVKFSSQRSLFRHHQKKHENTVPVAVQICTQCNLQFATKGEFNLHIVKEHTNETSFELMNQAFREKHQDWRKTLATTMQPESLFYGHYFQEVVTFLNNQKARLKTFTYNLVLVCIYESPISGEINDTFRQGKLKIYTK